MHMLPSCHKLLFIKRMRLIGVAFYIPDLDQLVSSPDPTLKEEKDQVNLGRILRPALRNFHTPMRS